MLTDRSFVITVTPEPISLRRVRQELADRLPPSHVDQEVLFVAALMCRQAQTWQGGVGPVRLRASTLGRVVQVEVIRDVDEGCDTGPASTDGFQSLLEVLAQSTERFTVSTFPGTVSLAAQKVVQPVPAVQAEPAIDLRVAA